MLVSQTFLFNLDAQLLFNTILLALSVFVLFLILSNLLFNPVRKVLMDRQERIYQDRNSAREDRESAAGLKADYESKRQNIEKEAEEILSKARQKALKNEARIIDEAKEEASYIIKRAYEDAELLKKQKAEEVKQEMIAVASLIAGKVIAVNMDSRIQDSLVENTLKEIGGSTWLS